MTKKCAMSHTATPIIHGFLSTLTAFGDRLLDVKTSQMVAFLWGCGGKYAAAHAKIVAKPTPRFRSDGPHHQDAGMFRLIATQWLILRQSIV